MDCPRCGQPHASGARFCGECGLALSSAGAGREQGGAVTPERRLITVLFCDLVSSTQLAEALDPEDLSGVMTRYSALANDVIMRFGGHISQWVGDGVQVYFGFPRAHEDDAERAVRCALEIVEAIQAARSAPERGQELELSVRIGVNTGTTVVGAEAADSRGGTLAWGDAPNIAARIQAAGAPGTVTIGERTQRLVEGCFELEALGEHELKGIAKPVALYRVLAWRSDVSRFDARTVRGLSPLVDRKDECRLLRSTCELACDGRVAAVLLRGEPGIGKSRLVHAAIDVAEQGLGMQSMVCECSPFHQGDPLYPLLDALRRRWRVDREGVAERLSGMGLAAPAVAVLSRALGATASGASEPPEVIRPQRERQDLLSAIVQSLLADSRRTPLLLTVEDLHWVDPTTLEALGALLGEREGSLLMVLTARPEFPPPWEPGPEVIDLAPLGEADTLKLIGQISGRGSADRLARAMAQRAEGVPLFAEELARAVPTTSAAGEAEVPSSLYGCLMARLDGDVTARSVAQLAAAVGRRFELPLLDAVGVLAAPYLRDGLDRLVQGELIIAETDERFVFRHALIQEAALGSLLREKRRTYHALIARTLLERFPDTARVQPERVARHFENAAELAPAIEQWRLAGLLALERSAYEEASGHFERALSLAPKLPDGAERDPVELELHVLAAVPLVVIENWTAPATVAHYRRAEELCRRVDGAPQLFPTMHALIAHRIVSGQLEQAVELGVEQVAVAERAGDPGLILEAECEVAAALVFLGRFSEAAPRHERVLSLYRPELHHRHHTMMFGRDPGMSALIHRAWAQAWMGDSEAARGSIAAATRLVEAWPHPHSEAWCRVDSAMIARLLGDFDAMADAAQRALTLSIVEGFPSWKAQAAAVLGWSRAAGGNVDAGLELVRRGVEAWEKGGALLCRGYLRGLLADTLRMAGRIEEALVELDVALGYVAVDPTHEPELRRLQAELLAAHGDHDGALEVARRAVLLVGERGVLGYLPSAEATLRQITERSGVL